MVVLQAILLTFQFYRLVSSQFPTYAENVTEVLDRLLNNYRKEIRPGFGGPPLVIETDMLIRSIGQISESEMDYSFQCYFRQRWTDERLKFDVRNITEVTLNNLFLSNIWKPNTYFLNGQKSHQHNIPRPNLFVRIRNDGRVYLSRRLTVKAACPMKLNLYPMDRPVCSLVLGSYGFTTDDVLYLWKYGNDKSVEVNTDVRLSQFDLIAVKASNNTDKSTLGEFSLLKIYIYFERHIGFFILQTYLPCSMITCLSWVSFWINRDAAPARVLLGVTTILATAGIGMTVREGLPRVSYATALDMYLNVCIFYLMAAMIEYAAVNYFTKVMPLEGGADETDEDDLPCVDHGLEPGETGESLGVSPGSKLCATFFNIAIVLKCCVAVGPDKRERQALLAKCVEGVNVADSINSSLNHVSLPTRKKKRRKGNKLMRHMFQCLTGNTKYRMKMRGKGNPEEGNSVSDIDLWCRYLFPGTFLTFNLCYWVWYSFINGKGSFTF